MEALLKGLAGPCPNLGSFGRSLLARDMHPFVDGGSKTH